MYSGTFNLYHQSCPSIAASARILLLFLMLNLLTLASQVPSNSRQELHPLND